MHLCMKRLFMQFHYTPLLHAIASIPVAFLEIFSVRCGFSPTFEPCSRIRGRTTHFNQIARKSRLFHCVWDETLEQIWGDLYFTL